MYPTPFDFMDYKKAFDKFITNELWKMMTDEDFT
jgi:hypothetical protein